MKYIIILFVVYMQLISDTSFNEDNATYEELVKDYQSAKFLNKAASKINENLPMRINNFLRVDNVFARNKNIIYNYTILNSDKKNYTSEFFKQRVEKKVKIRTCSSKGTKTFLKYDVTVSYDYYDLNGKFIYGIDTTKSDCAKLLK